MLGACPLPVALHRIKRERMQRRDGQQKNQRQSGDQDIQSNLVGRLLALGALDQRDHLVEKRFAWIGRDLDLDLIGQNSRSAGNRATVATGFADHRGALACNHRLVHRRDAVNDFTVARDQIPASANTRSPERNLDAGTISIFPLPKRRFAIESVFVFRSVSACALPRASAIASAKLANSTVNQSHSEI